VNHSNESHIFDALNHTELYQLCRGAEIYVSPDATREKMVAYLSGEEEPELVQHPIDDWRHGLMRFVIDYWKKLETQITCPAKSRDPKACFQCIDTRVIACVVTNEPNENLIHIRKPMRGT
jgi:hypothetical protein